MSDKNDDYRKSCFPYPVGKVLTFPDRVVIVGETETGSGISLGLTYDAAVIVAADLLRWARVQLQRRNP